MALAAEASGGARAVGPALRPRGDQAVLGAFGDWLVVGMAGTPAPGSRRRSGPPAPSPGPPPSTGHPPSKRARGFPAAAAPDPEDPFGAHGDFTADDLEELDTLASQALSQCPAAARDVFSECASGPFPRRVVQTCQTLLMAVASEPHGDRCHSVLHPHCPFTI